ncbi:MAG: (2Fe-2S) ferredoxin domain-containing protein [Clostridiales bacterium]|nr:(2Fe-2S) ferredoxin domain-containing protein [Clostridiales bacterium]
MKSLEELGQIKKEALKDMILRKGKYLTKIMVAMDDCGIKAGAKEVMNLFVKELRERNIMDAVVMMTSCQGMCDREPMVKIIDKDESVTVYANVTQDKVVRIIEDHILKGNVCKDLLA